jgi:hypothetical protein
MSTSKAAINKCFLYTVAPKILNVSLFAQLGKNLLYPSNRSLGGLWSRAGRFEQYDMLLPGIEPRFFSCRTSSLVTIPTELYRLFTLYKSRGILE